MKQHHGWIVNFCIMVACFSLTACERKATTTETNEPVTVENIAGSDLHRLILTAEGAKRIDIQMLPVRELPVNGILKKVVPYSSIIYDPNGEAYVYINTGPLAFIRAHIVIEAINNGDVILSDGPPADTQIVTVGPSELYGAEFQGTLEP